MWNWEKLSLFGINKVDKNLVSSEDNIHCDDCREHVSDHGEKEGDLLHPLDIANIINKE
jgi:hypothetical protein